MWTLRPKLPVAPEAGASFEFLCPPGRFHIISGDTWHSVLPCYPQGAHQPVCRLGSLIQRRPQGFLPEKHLLKGILDQLVNPSTAALLADDV
jgi:hypothetical protein